MASTDSSDLYLKFVIDGTAPNGTAIDAEAKTKLISLRKVDNLLKGFADGQFMEVDNFNFTIGKTRSTTAEKNKPLVANVGPTGSHGAAGPVTFKPRPADAVPDPDADGNHVDPEPISFDRTIDKSSKILMDHLLKRKVFDHATIIKRKSAGGPSAGEVYLRLDFTKVLIKHIGWSNDLPVKESVQFIYRSVTMHYRPQLPDGTLGGAVQGFWKAMGSDATAVDLT
jgi:type VI protein secretion system component Hcp